MVDAEAGDTGAPATSQPQGFRSVLRDYHPTRGPIEPETALVLDPCYVGTITPVVTTG